MNRFQKLIRTAAAAVIILTVGSATAEEIEFQINPNKLPPCPEPDLSKTMDVGLGGRTEKWNNCWGNYELYYDNLQRQDDNHQRQEWKGNILRGEWRNGKLNGKGEHIQWEGGKYTGDFKNGLPEGFGETRGKFGYRYIGEHKSGVIDGYGTEYEEFGGVYVGNFSNGYRNGQGKLIDSNGNQYVGEWRNGVKHGQGIYATVDGKNLEGIFESNTFIQEKKIDLSRKSNNSTLGVERTYIERERQQLAEDRRRIEEEKRNREQQRQSQRVNLQVTHTQPAADGSITIGVQTNADTASLLVNSEEQGGRANGKYSVKKVARAGGDTQFIIIATDINGNTDTKTITVSRPVAESKPLVAALNPAQMKRQPERDAVAIIIGIADYKNLPRADYANDDARVFYDYAIRALGVKPENIKLLVDADADDVAIYRAFKTWLPSRVRASTDVYVYYSGHGLPTADGQGLYVLPQRADRDFIDKTAITQAEINAAIQAAKPKSVTVFLDACYSGQSRSGETLIASARPVALKAAMQLFPDSFAVFSASQNDQISSSSPDLKHGIFSYYLMRGMEGDADANRDGRITAGEMQAYLTENVARQAGMQNRVQQPQLIGDANRVLVGR